MPAATPALAVWAQSCCAPARHWLLCQTEDAREHWDLQAEVSCKSTRAQVDRGAAWGHSLSLSAGVSCGRMPRRTSLLLCFTHHGDGKCSDRGSAVFTATKPQQKTRVPSERAADSPAACLQCACSLRRPSRPSPEEVGLPGKLQAGKVPAYPVAWQQRKNKTLTENVMKGNTKEQMLQEGAAEG